LRDFEEKLLNMTEYSEEWEEHRKGFIRWDRSFHDKLLLSCGNEYWIKIYFQIRGLVIISANSRSYSKETVKGAMQEHHQILDVLRDGHYAKARELLAEHILNTKRYDNRYLQRLQRVQSIFGKAHDSL
jgi:DNA-binding FadR family transcriptional regulator